MEFGLQVVVVAVLAVCVSVGQASAPEPYAYLNDGGFTGPQQPASSDPNVQYQWNGNVNATLLQLYVVRAVKVTAVPPSSFLNVDSLTSGQFPLCLRSVRACTHRFLMSCGSPNSASFRNFH